MHIAAAESNKHKGQLWVQQLNVEYGWGWDCGSWRVHQQSSCMLLSTTGGHSGGCAAAGGQGLYLVVSACTSALVQHLLGCRKLLNHHH
jgi:hypothetical protein